MAPPPPAPAKLTGVLREPPSGKVEAEEEAEASGNLWVGNLPPDAMDAELTPLFARYGALESVSTFPARNYAFVHFKRYDDAQAAKHGLQGVPVRGNPIKIEFARPARPCKQLWIGGISSSVTKEQLEDEFSKFGNIEDYKFLRDRNCALIDFYKIDDANAALKSMNGKRLGGEQIRVDYLRSQPLRRDWFDFHEARDGYFGNKRGMSQPEPLWMPPDSTRFFPEASHYDHNRFLLPGGRRDGLPSKVLCIVYPPSVQIDEQMLHNAMILFGEIECIKSFPSRHFSLVEFRSIDEARRAKEGLQGRLFNDPRIHILFSDSELVAPNDNLPFIPGPRGPRADMFFGEHPFGPMEYFGPGHPMASSNFPGALPPNMSGSNMLGRPFAAQGFDPLHGSSEFFNDVNVSAHHFPDINVNNPMAANFRRLSPSLPGVLSPAPGMRPPMIPLPGMWDGPDGRDPKRSRADGPHTEEAPLLSRRMGGQGFIDPYVFHEPGRGATGSGSPVRVKGPVGGFPGPNEHHVASSRDYCWRGIIAKGGTPVCHARCVPLGKGVESPFPEIVNCSARTGLDMLTKHYTEAVGFDVVFFLPDSEDDFASYTEFLRYLGLKSRAGVAKLDDGATMFLVPPSEFLTKVLKISGPERLYGVLLKMPQQAGASMHQPKQTALPSTSLLADRQQTPPPQTGSGYIVAPWNDDQAPQVEYNRPEESLSHTTVGKPFSGRNDESRPTQSVALDYVSNHASAQPAEVSLTPELIATLASVIPSTALPSSGNQIPLNSSMKPTYVSVPMIPEQGGMPPQIWTQEPQPPAALEQHSHPSIPLTHQFGNQSVQLPSYVSMSHMPNTSGHVFGGTHVQDNVQGAQQAASIPTMPFSNYPIPPQSGQFSASHANQQTQMDSGFSSNKSYVSQPAEGFIRAIGPQQSNPSTSSQVQGGNALQHWIVSPLTAENMNTDFPTQVQNLQNAMSSSIQGSSEGEADKNQRYQSTLQLAASLLLQIQQQQQQQQQQQIQQQQQQANAQAMQGSGNQQ